MTMTNYIKDELSSVKPSNLVLERLELISLLRFAGGIHIIAKKIVFEVELYTLNSAKRFQKFLLDIYNFNSEMIIFSGSLQKNEKYLIRVSKEGESLARKTGIIDRKGRPVLGLPPDAILSNNAQIGSILRGAFLARGSLSDVRRSTSLEITSPGFQAALALSGIMRRVGIHSKVRQVRGVHKVVISNSTSISTMLRECGAKKSEKVFNEYVKKHAITTNINRLANFDNANLRRSAQAAVLASERIRRAFEILGDSIPPHIREAGELRLKHKDVSLEELGRISDPPLSKDAIAGRLRRLLTTADQTAHEQGIDDTFVGISSF